VHYLVCDAEGDRAAIELLNHRMVVHRGTAMPCPTLANDPYEASVDYLKEHPQLSYLQTARRSASSRDVVSISRFARANASVGAFTARGPRRDVNYAFDTLKEVAQGDFTVWQMVYEISARKIQYATRSNPQRRTLELKTLDFSGTHPVRFVNIRAGGGGRGLTFAPLTEERHRQYLETFYAQRSLKEKLGETEPLMTGLLATLRGYRQAH
jgi:penicillin V acylase-like amidase (Ntn superfamily)